jgi:hypothetical protein
MQLWNWTGTQRRLELYFEPWLTRESFPPDFSFKESAYFYLQEYGSIWGWIRPVHIRQKSNAAREAGLRTAHSLDRLEDVPSLFTTPGTHLSQV